MDNFTAKIDYTSREQRLYRIPTRVLKRLRSRPFTCDFSVVEIGHLPKATTPLLAGERKHKSHLLIFNPRGNFSIRIKNKTHPVSDKQAILIPPCTPYQYGSNSDSPWDQYWIKFDSLSTGSLLEWTSFSSSSPVINCTASENLKRHFNAILNAVDRGYTEHTTLQLSLALIKILISLHENPLDRGAEGSTNRIESAMSQMREDVSKPQPLSSYAKKTGYSITQFSFLFRQHTGTSPINYLNELRIQRAAEYLKNTDHSIKSIAHSLGFEDPLYFSRSFRKCVGLSPSAYRER